jgi:hypothetical protein
MSDDSPSDPKLVQIIPAPPGAYEKMTIWWNENELELEVDPVICFGLTAGGDVVPVTGHHGRPNSRWALRRVGEPRIDVPDLRPYFPGRGNSYENLGQWLLDETIAGYLPGRPGLDDYGPRTNALMRGDLSALADTPPRRRRESILDRLRRWSRWLGDDGLRRLNEGR